jgi:hypothetical protein
LVERLGRIEEAWGSIPHSSTTPPRRVCRVSLACSDQPTNPPVGRSRCVCSGPISGSALAIVLAAAGGVLAHARSRGRTRRREGELATLDPVTDHQEIAFTLGAYEFPWDFETALSLAFFRTFASPTISALLAETGAFAHGPRKRYDDTELLLAEILEHGYDSPQGKAAIRRINAMHGAFDIADEDMLYVLCTFVFEPIRWADRFGWRALTDAERQGMFEYWRQLGPRLMVHGIPDTIEELERFYGAYEAERFRYTDSNAAVADAAMRVLLDRLPARLRPLGRDTVVALFDPPVRRACGYADPAPAVERAVVGGLRVRAALLRELAPERRHPFLITQRRSRTYPDGYDIERLGTFPAEH